jgi:hypothetical protein
LISSVGYFTNALENNTACENVGNTNNSIAINISLKAEYFINSTAFDTLGQVFQLCLQYEMSVFIGLLDMESNLPNVSGPCMDTYAQIQVLKIPVDLTNSDQSRIREKLLCW